MNVFLAASEEYKKAALENAANVYYKSTSSRECVSCMQAPKPGAEDCDREMFEAVMRGLGQILTADLERRSTPPFFIDDPLESSSPAANGV